MWNTKVFISIVAYCFLAGSLLGAQADMVQNPSDQVTEPDLRAMVYKPDFPLPSPLPVLRVGFPYLNYFMPEAWTSGLFGLGWGASFFNLADIHIRNFGVSGYYGIGGMRFIDHPGAIDLAKGPERNQGDFFWGAMSSEVEVGNGFTVVQALSGALSSTAENNYWALDLGIAWDDFDNPNLPDKGQRLGLTTHGALVRHTLTPALSATWKYYLGTGNPGNALGLSLDARSLLTGKPRGDGAIAYVANNLVYWDPLIIDGNQGMVFLGEQALALELSYRIRYFRLSSIFDGGESKEPWVNGLHAYVEPFVFAAAQNSGPVVHYSYGFGLRNLFATVTGPYSTKPLVVGASVDFGGLDDGTWLSLLLDF